MWWVVARAGGLLLLALGANWMAQAWTRFEGDGKDLAMLVIVVGISLAILPDVEARL